VLIFRFLGTAVSCGLALFAQAQGPGAGKGPGPQPGGGLPLFGPPPGVALFQKNCASCHTAEGLEMNGRIAPTISALNATAPERIFEALSTGKMKEQAASLTNRDRRDLSEYLARRPIPQPAAADVSKMANP